MESLVSGVGGWERGGGCVDGVMEGRFWGEEGAMLLWGEYWVISELEASGILKDLSGLREAAMP